MSKLSKAWRARASRRSVLKAGLAGTAGSLVDGGLPRLATRALADSPAIGPQAMAVSVPSLLVLTDTVSGNPYSSYLGEILRAEGVRDFEVRTLSQLTSSLLAGRSVVLLGESAPSTSQRDLLDTFVSAGGGLVAMKPATVMGPICGFSGTSGTLSDAYMRITDSTLGGGLYTDTMQFHGVANTYGLVGATQIAQLYSDRATSTSSPAVTLATRGSGQAAMFAYDLAKSVVLTRQGNPANANIDKDQDGVVRTVDLYNSWVDLQRTRVPQADVQQRLLVRLIEAVAPRPTPRVWYFPNAKASVIVITGDAHANPQSYYQAEIDAMRQRGVTMTFYLAPSAPPTSVIQGWMAQGFDFAPHPYVDTGYQSSYQEDFDNFEATYGFAPKTVRTHMVRWLDWTTAANIEAQQGVQMDFNSYQWGAWLNGSGGPATGYTNGSGQPMRFIDSSGTILPIYQQHTTLVDEELAPEVGVAGLSGSAALAISKQTIDDSIGGYYAAIATQFHVDYFGFGGVNDWVLGTIDYALQKGLQPLTADAWNTFVQQRAATSLANSTWGSNTLSFDVTAGGANQTLLLPLQHRGANLTSVKRNGSSVSASSFTVNGKVYASFTAATGSYTVTYAADATAPIISNVSSSTTPSSAVITWTTDELATSVVQYGTGGNTDQNASTSGFATNHSVTLTNLTPNTDYSYRVVSADASGNSATGQTLTLHTNPLGAPTLASVSPTSGATASAQTLTLTGTGFVSGATVLLGQTQLGGVVFNSATSLQATVPAGFAPGTYDVTVRNPDGQTGTLTAGYRVLAAPPTLLGVSPTTGLPGQQVTLNGNNFVSGATAKIGTTAATTAVQSGTSATMVVPAAMAAGAYSVTITNPDGQSSTLSNAFTVATQQSVGHTTQGEFAAGTLTNTQAIAGGSAGDGAVALGSTGWSDSFPSSTLDPARWAQGLWQPDGSITVSPGAVSIKGGWISSLSTMSSGSVTARLTFQSSAFQNFGLSRSDNLDNPWFLFGVPGFDTSNVYARFNSNSGNGDIALPGLIGAPHDYTIQYQPGLVRWLVDGQQVYQQTIGSIVPNALATWLSVGQTGLPLVANSVSTATYAPNGTLVSAPLDAGGPANWLSFTLQQDNPANTSTQAQVRSSVNGTSWSAWSTAVGTYPFNVSLPVGRYLQYQLSLATTDSTSTPLVTSTTAYYQPTSNPTVASVVVSPSSAALTAGGTQQFTAAVLDSQGQPVPNATVTWSVTSGGGTISPTGLFTAGATPGTFANTVVATSSGLTGTATVTVNPGTPVVTSISPTSGSTAGGTNVTISGSNFVNGASVTLGGTPATNVTVVNSTTLTATTPAHTVGPVDVVVTNQNSQPGTLANGYTFATPPALVGVEPSAIQAGQQTTLTGTNFVTGATVKVGAMSVTTSVQHPTTAVITTPSSLALGVYDVTLTNPDGQATTLASALTIAAERSVGHTTQAEFAAGELTNAQAIAGGSAGDGAVVLGSSGWSDNFPGSTLNTTLWTQGLWQPDGSVTVTPGSVSVKGGWIRSQSTFTAGSVTARLTFLNSAFQNFGLSRGDDLDNPWFLFGTPGFDTGNVYARFNTNSAQGDVKIGPVGQAHDYTIQYQPGLVRWLVDGQQVHQVVIGTIVPSALTTWLSVGQTGLPLVANAVTVATYAPAGTLLSAPLDAGGPASWLSFTVQQTTPAGATTAVRTRSSTDAANWSAWSASATTYPFDLSVPSGRYLQYELSLGSSDPTVTPQVATTTAFYRASAASVTVSPSTASLLTGGTQQFSATVLDGQGQPIPTATVAWSVVNGGGTISTDGLFTAGTTAGTYADTIVATSDGANGTASVTVTLPAPVATSINPTAGINTGGTNVTISGSNFLAGATVKFGSVAATVTNITATSITATTPAQTSGVVDVIVTNPDNQQTTLAGGFRYAGVPVVTGVSPNAGPTGGGTRVTVSGSDFTGATSVRFGNSNGTSVVVNSDSSVSATSPFGSAGVVDVRVVTTFGTSAVSPADRFTYMSRPAITNVNPDEGPTAGGTSVAITGTNFTGVTAVTFEGTNATSFTVNSATSITAVSPPRSAGTADIQVTTPGGTSSNSSADNFDYRARPSVSSVSPSSGTVNGGTTVTVRGNNFTGVTAVLFGTRPGTNISVLSSTRLTVRAPAGVAKGVVDVTVTTAGGTSAVNSNDRYTYT